MIKDSVSFSLGLTELDELQLKEIKTRTNDVYFSGARSDIPAWNKGMLLEPRDEKTKEKISNTLTGQALSEERKNNISVSIKKLYQEQKNIGFRKNAFDAGKIGGKSKSEAKIQASLKNLKKSLEIVKGSSWMYDKKTKKRSRVGKNFIEKKLEEGWVFGMGEGK